ncbi:MAG: amino acid adenylation domain-containing protein [Tahibacter sp.]
MSNSPNCAPSDSPVAAANFPSFVEVLRHHAQSHGEDIAFIYLKDGEQEESSLSFGDLERRARAIAARLQAMAAPGDRALLLFPSGLDYICAFFGCLFAGVVAVPIYPPQSQRNKVDRLRSVVADCSPTCVLATSEILEALHGDAGAEALLVGMRTLATDGIAERDVAWEMPELKGSSLAFLQYTSGSTGLAKGVMVSHANLLHNQAMIQRGFATDRNSVVVGWLPLYHDMGLIGNVLHPIYLGAKAVLMSPMAFLQKPLRWLQAIERYRGTVSGGPNFAYQLCVDRIGVARRAELDLTEWRVAFNGAEPIRAQTLREFSSAFANGGFSEAAFLPCYGLAEATLFVCGGKPNSTARQLNADGEALRQHHYRATRSDSGIELIGCGTILADSLMIVDPRGKTQLKDGQVGEIWLASPSVAQGYWRKEHATLENFQAYTTSGSVPHLRTGDFGFVHDGELFVTGRLKELIIVRGRNHYPQDIEQTVQSTVAALTSGAGAAFAVDVDGEERLVVVQEVQRTALRQIDLEDVENRVRAAISEVHEVRLHELVLIKPMRLPKTSSGKIKRRETRELYLGARLEAIGRDFPSTQSNALSASGLQQFGASNDAETSALLKKVRQMFAEVLRASVDAISTEQSITALGIDSLAAIEFQHRVEIQLQRACPLEWILAGESLRALSERLRDAQPIDEQLLQPCGLSQGPLSYNQQAMWFMHSMHPHHGAYNVALPIRVRSPLACDDLAQAWRNLVRTHAILRTRYAPYEGVPIQMVEIDSDNELERFDVADWDDSRMGDALAQAAGIPWQLEPAAPFRLQCYRRNDSDYVLLLLAHHISVDMYTMVQLLRELLENYATVRQGDIPIGHAPLYGSLDFSRWQQAFIDSEAGRHQLGFWQQRLAGPLPILQLPSDRPRPRLLDHAGDALNFRIDSDLSASLRKLAAARGATLYTLLLSAYCVFLHKYADVDEICVGSPVSARTRKEFSDSNGFFVNTLVTRAKVSGNPPFQEFVGQIRDQAIDALAHRDIPIAYLVEKLCPDRDPGISPLFQTLFALQDPHDFPAAAAFVLGETGKAISLGGLTLEPWAHACAGSQFDLSLFMVDSDDGLCARFEFRSALFDRARVDAMAKAFAGLLGAVAADPGVRLGSIALPSRDQRKDLLEKFRGQDLRFDEKCGLVELIAAQASAAPNAVALVHDGREIDYAELVLRARILAGLILDHGAGVGDRVGICLPRGVDRYVAILAVLIAGGTYVPMDPAYPIARLRLIADLADARLLLVADALLPEMLALGRRMQNVGAMWTTATVAPIAGVAPLSSLPIYLMFTSGSTGTPKGVLMNQVTLLNLLHWQQSDMPLQAGDRVSQFAAMNFDVSFQEIFGTWCFGGTLIVVADEQRHDPALLVALFEKERVCRAYLPGVVLQQLAQHVADCGASLSALKDVVCAGEQLVLSDEVRRMFARMPGARLYNHYGPTESHVVTRHVLDGNPASWMQQVPIGTAISNVNVYLLDRAGCMVPNGVPGELCIGGASLADGYWGRGDLTADRFEPDPYAEISGARLYRTGDLARWCEEGGFEYLGRRDSQVQLRGFRIELGEIESVLVALDAVVEGAVLLREDQPGVQQLVAYVVLRDAIVTAEALRSSLKRLLPDYMVPADIVMLHALPISPNGKVDKKALPAPGRQAMAIDQVAPRNDVEQRLAKIWSDVLGIELVDIHMNFFDSGGYSLLATKLVTRVRAEFAIDLPVGVLFEAPTIAEFALRVATATPTRIPAPVRVPRDQDLPLSYAQQRLWFLEQLEGPSANYNMPAAFELRGCLRVDALRESFSDIVLRHESLRTRFVEGRDGPIQIVDQGIDFTMAVVEADDSNVALRIREHAARPFLLHEGRLIRVELLRLAADRHVMLVNLHHIVADGWSIAVLVRELAERYTKRLSGEAPLMSELPIQYADFAFWQRAWYRGDVLARQLAYWRRQLDELPPLLEIPGDRLRPPMQSLRGGVHKFRFPDSLRQDLLDFSARQSASLLMCLMAGFQIVISRYSGQLDVAIGTPVANRPRPEMEGLIGFFVNTLVIRNQVEPAQTFLQHLDAVRTTVLAAQANQDLPFEQLVEELKPARSLSHSPLVQIMLLLHDGAANSLALPDLDISRHDDGFAIARFDLALNIEDRAESLFAWFDYAADLFDAERMEALGASFLRVLEAAISDSARDIARLPLLAGEEISAQLRPQADLLPARNPARCVHELFEAQAARTPDAPAVVFGDETLSYAQLDRCANHLADALYERGVRGESRVGVWMERSPRLLVSILAIWKCSGTYVPMDPGYPKDRLDYIAGDAELPFILTDSQLAGALAAPAAPVLMLDELMLEEPGPRRQSTRRDMHELHPAYVIYTSGSTGKPKGVQVLQGGLSELLLGLSQRFSCSSIDSMPSLASHSFGISFVELLLPIISGGHTRILPREVVLDSDALCRELENVTMAHLVPSLMRRVLGHLGDSPVPRNYCALRHIFVGGDAVAPTLLGAMSETFTSAQIVEFYGQTETTILSCHAPQDGNRESGNVIGLRLPHAQIYVLDGCLQPLPQGCIGEIHVGGHGVARGYLGRPDQTAERFLPHPFSSDRGACLYRTGDLGRLLADGRVEYVGRADFQVNVRGFRVELGEIETVLREAPEVSNAIVSAIEDERGDKKLIAYLVASEGHAIVVAELRQRLRSALPDYMMPAHFLMLDAFPTNANGKVDRKALPEPGTAESTETYVAPRDEFEGKLALIWMELLKLPRVGVNDNFFELGGHSLLAAQAMTRVRQCFDLPIGVADFFEAQTVAGLAMKLNVRLRERELLSRLTAGDQSEAENEESFIF